MEKFNCGDIVILNTNFKSILSGTKVVFEYYCYCSNNRLCRVRLGNKSMFIYEDHLSTCEECIS